MLNENQLSKLEQDISRLTRRLLNYKMSFFNDLCTINKITITSVVFWWQHKYQIEATIICIR